MTTAHAHAPAISLRERYGDVVSDRWPVTVMPQPDELLSSWLHRLALANGVSPRAFARVLGLNPGMWSAALDLRLPADIANLLYAKTGVAHDQLAAMTGSQDLPKQLLLPLRNIGRRDGSTWLQFCSRCLASDEHPYFRRSWRLATRVSCGEHRSGLRDRCPSCKHRIESYCQGMLVPQHVCAHCGFDLRRASRPYISVQARRLDICIAEMYRRKARAGSADLDLFVGRLLRIPDLVSLRTRSSLPSLSASIRIRCFEILADRLQ